MTAAVPASSTSTPPGARVGAGANDDQGSTQRPRVDRRRCNFPRARLSAKQEGRKRASEDPILARVFALSALRSFLSLPFNKNKSLAPNGLVRRHSFVSAQNRPENPSDPRPRSRTQDAAAPFLARTVDPPRRGHHITAGKAKHRRMPPHR